MTFFDTSVLTAAAFREHPHHSHSFRTLESAQDRVIAAHSMAEFYSSTTGIQTRLRIHPQTILAAVSEWEQRFRVVALTPREYSAAISRAAALGIAGGAVYDLLIACCALKAKADVLYTWNLRHFLRLGDDVAAIARSPADAR